MIARPGKGELDALAGLGTATIAEVAPRPPRFLDPGLRPLERFAPAYAGVALTVRCRPGDNLALHRALARARPGDLLVVDYGGDATTGPFGEIMALAAHRAGLRGLVIDGAVRDSAQIAALGFGVHCRATAVPGTTKDDPGEIGTTCAIGGTTVATGDIVLADADAIAVIAPADLAAVLARGTERLAQEAAIMERIRRGETTCDIFGLPTGQSDHSKERT